MSKRNRVKRFDSTRVQGEGSFVEVLSMTVGEQRTARKVAADKGDMFELGIKIMKEHVVSWNWVDDDGKPFAQPKDQPNVVLELTDDEVSFLTDCIRGSTDDEKN